MKRPLTLGALIVLGAVATGGCRHTWDGAKTDTRRAVQKTGHGIEKAGAKIEGAGQDDEAKAREKEKEKDKKK